MRIPLNRGMKGSLATSMNTLDHRPNWAQKNYALRQLDSGKCPIVYYLEYYSGSSEYHCENVHENPTTPIMPHPLLFRKSFGKLTESIPVFRHASTGRLHLLCKFRIVRGTVESIKTPPFIFSVASYSSWAVWAVTGTRKRKTCSAHKPQDVMPGDDNRQPDKKHDAGKVDNLIRSRSERTVTQGLDQHHHELTAVESWKRQQVHDSEAETENTCKKKQIRHSPARRLAGHHGYPERT